MKLPQEVQILRIFIGENDKYDGKPLYEWLVLKAKKEGLAGATVQRGLMGYGATSRIHTSKILRLSMDLPIVVEIVDAPEKIGAFLTCIESVVTEGLITQESAKVHLYKGKKQQ